MPRGTQASWRIALMLAILMLIENALGYSENNKWVPMSRSRFPAGSLRESFKRAEGTGDEMMKEEEEIMELLTPNSSIALDYGWIENLRGYTSTTHYYSEDDYEYVKVEDAAEIIEVSCTPNDDINSTATTQVKMQFLNDFAYNFAKDAWGHNVLLNIHDPTCDGVDTRSFYLPITRQFEDTTKTMVIGAQLRQPATNEVGSRLQIIEGQTPEDLREQLKPRFWDLVAKHPDMEPKLNALRKRGWWSDLKEDFKNLWDSCKPHRGGYWDDCMGALGDMWERPIEEGIEKLLNREGDIQWDHPMDPRETIIDWDQFVTLTCVDCHLKLAMTARTHVDIMIKARKAFKHALSFHWGEIPRDLVNDAFIEISAIDDVEVALQLEVKTNLKADFWCNIIPDIPPLYKCGAGVGWPSLYYGSKPLAGYWPGAEHGKVRFPGQSKGGPKYDFKMKGAAPKFEEGTLAIWPGEVWGGLWFDLNVGAAFNITTPGAALRIKKGGVLRYDFFAEEHVTNTMEAEITFRPPHAQVQELGITISVAISIGASLEIGEFVPGNQANPETSMAAAKVGLRFDLARFDTSLKEKIGFGEDCKPNGGNTTVLEYSVDFKIGVKAWVGTMGWELVSTAIPGNPLYKNVNLVKVCHVCKDGCVSGQIDKALDLAFNKPMEKFADLLNVAMEEEFFGADRNIISIKDITDPVNAPSPAGPSTVPFYWMTSTIITPDGTMLTGNPYGTHTPTPSCCE